MAVLDVSTMSGRTSGVRFERPTLGVRQFRPTEIHIKLRAVLDDPPTAHLAVYVCRGRAEHLCFLDEGASNTLEAITARSLTRNPSAPEGY